jgi:hypothetical protein
MGAQIKKGTQDILKLALIKNQPNRAQTRTVVAFASQDAHDSITGWVRGAARTFGVDLVVVNELPAGLREEIITAQRRQVMVHPPLQVHRHPLPQ